MIETDLIRDGGLVIKKSSLKVRMLRKLILPIVVFIGFGGCSDETPIIVSTYEDDFRFGNGRKIIGLMTTYVRFEVRESLTINSMVINEGNCVLPIFEYSKLPMTVGMGTVMDERTDCDVVVQIEMKTDKGVFTYSFDSPNE